MPVRRLRGHVPMYGVRRSGGATKPMQFGPITRISRSGAARNAASRCASAPASASPAPGITAQPTPTASASCSTSRSVRAGASRTATSGAASRSESEGTQGAPSTSTLRGCTCEIRPAKPWWRRLRCTIVPANERSVAPTTAT